MRFLVLVAMCAAAGPAAAQALLEHALAAGGGSAAGVAGKTVSDGIDRIFRKVDKQLESAESGATAKQKKGEPWYANMYSTPLARPGAGAKPGSKVVNPLMTLPSLTYDPLAVYIAPPPRMPRRPSVTPAQIAHVTPGASRDAVLSSLGRPSARITIPDGSTLVEIYQYYAQGATVGTLRLADGVVSSVRAVDR